jgi:hypothetical protein
MKRQARPQAIVQEMPLDRDHVLRELAASAERFVNKAPKQQRLAADREALLQALTHAQLILSVSKSSS